MRIFEKDQVNSATKPLNRLLRLIVYHRGVTVDHFTHLFSRWHVRQMGMPEAMTSIARSNHRRRLLEIEKMSWQTFQRLLQGIFCLPISRFSVTVVNNDGSETEYHTQMFVGSDGRVHDPVVNTPVSDIDPDQYSFKFDDIEAPVTRPRKTPVATSSFGDDDGSA